MFVHSADTHLGYRSYDARGTRFNQREEDVYRSWDELIQFCIKERPEFLLIAGDMFDSPTPPMAAMKEALRVGDLPCICVIVEGNHERPRAGEISPVEVLDRFDNVRVATSPMKIQVGENTLFLAPDTGIAYDFEPASILVAHGQIKGPEEYMHQTKYLNFNPKDYFYCALGDLHRYWRTENILYPGSLSRLTFGQENIDSGFIVYEGANKISFVKTTSRKFVTLYDQSDVDSFLKHEHPDKPVVRLVHEAPEDQVLTIREHSLQVKKLRKSVALCEISKALPKGNGLVEEFVTFTKDTAKAHLLEPGLEVIRGVDV